MSPQESTNFKAFEGAHEKQNISGLVKNEKHIPLYNPRERQLEGKGSLL